uniref:(northern house mosquito) hypothetical protein n=1 Tax=Culex pipiens TaxID=7175 RepID=A0A8D8KDT1_CULPI
MTTSTINNLSKGQPRSVWSNSIHHQPEGTLRSRDLTLLSCKQSKQSSTPLAKAYIHKHTTNLSLAPKTIGQTLVNTAQLRCESKSLNESIADCSTKINRKICLIV